MFEARAVERAAFRIAREIETSATDPHRSLAGVRRDAMDRIAK